MTEKTSWFPFYAGEFLADTVDFTPEQTGAYFLLMCSQWKSGGPLERGELYKYAKTSTAKRFEDKIWPDISRHFTQTGSLVSSAKIEELRNNIEAFSREHGDEGCHG